MKNLPNQLISGSIYIMNSDPEVRKTRVLKKYFEKVNKNMCKERVKMEKDFYAVADIAAKQFLSYVIIDCNQKIGWAYDNLKSNWEIYDVVFPRQRFSNLLKNVYSKGIVAEDKKMCILSVVIDTAFKHEDIYKYMVGRLQADNKSDLIKTLHKMADHFNYDENEFYRYLKPAKLNESEGQSRIYIKGKFKNLPRKSYDQRTFYEYE